MLPEGDFLELLEVDFLALLEVARPEVGYGGEVPGWLGGVLAQQESVRSVQLPMLPELSESEVGPLLAGDWLTMVNPFMSDHRRSGGRRCSGFRVAATGSGWKQSQWRG